MSNIAGKAYAMNVVTPMSRWTSWINKLILWAVTLPVISRRLDGLQTLSLIHYARWAIVSRNRFPHLSESQPREDLTYDYMFFFSNFNGSWDQYVDSFQQAIPSGLNLFWKKNIRYPKSTPLRPFQRYIRYNQIQTDYYFNAYPLASANDVKAAAILHERLSAFADERPPGETPEAFKTAFDALLCGVQEHISLMEPTPVVSLAYEESCKRERLLA